MDCRYRGNHRQLLHGALDHQPAIAAASGGGAAGGAFALRAQRWARPVPRRRGQFIAGHSRIEADNRPGDKRPAWQRALTNARLPLYDVHWTPAIVLEKPTGKKGETWRVGLADGRILPLSLENATAQRKLTLYDVVLTHVTDGNGKTATRADLRVRPVVQ